MMLVLKSDRASRENSSAWSPTTLESPITVEATGHEFFWRFRFPGPDAKFDTSDDVCVEKEIHLPLERDIVFLINSDDFVYTMAIPDLDLRQLAVPDLTFKMNFHTLTAGSYEVIADPLCGVRLFHDEFMGKIIVQSESAFDLWYKKVQ